LFERAKLIGLAIQARQQLIKIKPDSTLAKKAIYQIGRNYQDIAAFEMAAENYETFATKFPGEKEASTALRTASFFRRGLGENEKSISDTTLFTKTYGPRKEFTDQAAGVTFSEFQIFEQQKDVDKLKKHFVAYLKDWGAKGGVDRQIVAHVKIAELLWSRARCRTAASTARAWRLRVRERPARRASRRRRKRKRRRARRRARRAPTCRHSAVRRRSRRSPCTSASRDRPKRRWRTLQRL